MTNPASRRASSAAFDYIIVGSGAAGSVLADRLSRDSSASVLVLEAGGSDRSPLHRVPKGFFYTMGSKRYTKVFEAEPDASGYVASLPRGRVLGGSTTINGMFWNRGWASAYEAWQRSGIQGWSWDRFLVAFKALEDHELGESPARGSGGPVPVSVARPPDPVSDTFIAALGKHGIAMTDDMNDSDEERVAYASANVGSGLRVSASQAFLRPARRRPNVTVLTRAEVDRVTFDGSAATGVEVTRRGKKLRFRAHREVLVCAGGLDSPLLLERSGVGDPDILKAAGVPVVVPSPSVGENLNDHGCGLIFQVKLKGDSGLNATVSSMFGKGWTGFKYLFTREGLVSYGAYNVAAMYKSDANSPHPDTQAFFTPLSATAVHPRTGRMIVDKFPGAMLNAYMMYPTSRGSIHITGSGIKDKPRLIPNHLTTEHDRALLPKVYEKARELLATEPFAGLVEAEVVPGHPLGCEEIFQYCLTKAVGYHSIGGCAIGGTEDSVVDDRLRVRGTTKLRVVDASVFPTQPGGNNNAPTQAMAWIAADIIMEDHR